MKSEVINTKLVYNCHIINVYNCKLQDVYFCKLKIITVNYQELFKINKQEKLSGRYINNSHIESILNALNSEFKVETLGYSVNKKPIYSVVVGTGKIKVYMWSQMHGNESTTTKALFDLFRFLESNTIYAQDVKKKFTFFCIPILNPDGAEAYTRVNANEIDLNRDSLNLSQPESQVLRKVYEEFRPDYCFNLHDQRTIFAAGDTKNPATVSFLAPAYNEAREINETRRKAIAVIEFMNTILQEYIPNQIGRFDDSFNINCIGDMFQSLNTPTILFEAGHFQNDYQREETRKYIFISLISAIKSIDENVVASDEIHKYLDIPQNKPIFFDIVYRNVKINYDSINLITTFASQYREVLIDGIIKFESFISKVDPKGDFQGHIEYDCEGAIYSDELNNIPEIDKKTNFNLNNNVKFVNGLKKL
jgi:hypothetical protein